MAAPVLQEPILKAVGEVQTYVESSTDYLRLQTFKTLMRLLTSLSKSAVVGVLSVLALIFISASVALYLGSWLDDYALAFLLVGIFYLAVTGVAYLMRRRIEGSILGSFSDLYFTD